MEKILYFSQVNWSWIKQRPHFIPYYLEKMNYSVTHFSVSSILSRLRENKCNMKNKVNSKLLDIIKVKILPMALKSKLILKLNKMIINSTLKNNYDYIILTHPIQYEYINFKRIKSKKVIYECMDNQPSLSTSNLKLLKRLELFEEKLCRHVDEIIVSSNKLKEILSEKYGISDAKINIIYNAVDKKSVQEYTKKKIDLKTPNMVYVGTIGDWFDFEVINDFAQTNPHYHIYLVGPIDNKIIEKVKILSSNIIFTGPIEHNEIFNYIYNGEILILPFIINDVVECVDPVKIYEYLVFNKIVISSYWRELDKFTQTIYFYKNKDEFNNIVNKCSSELQNQDTCINDKFLNNNSWENRIGQYIDVLNK